MVIPMERYDRIISLIWIALGIGQCMESWVLGLGSMSEPGTGFIPFVVGLVIIVLSAILLLESSIEVKKNPGRKVSRWSDTHWRRVIYIVILLLAYALLLPKLGYLIATFLVLVFLLKSGEPIKWPAAIIVAILTSTISYLVFGIWLSVSFPKGILSF